MKLIVGGAYQGKLEYAKKHFLLADQQVYCCDIETETPEQMLCRMGDAACSVVYGMERFALACVRSGQEAASLLAQAPELLADKIVIVEDISCGVVPVEQETRAWREMNGRMTVSLANAADSVIRMFCGLPLQLK